MGQDAKNDTYLCVVPADTTAIVGTVVVVFVFVEPHFDIPLEKYNTVLGLSFNFKGRRLVQWLQPLQNLYSLGYTGRVGDVLSDPVPLSRSARLVAVVSEVTGISVSLGRSLQLCTPSLKRKGSANLLLSTSFFQYPNVCLRRSILIRPKGGLFAA